jgi:hypothetical protein
MIIIIEEKFPSKPNKDGLKAQYPQQQQQTTSHRDNGNRE